MMKALSSLDPCEIAISFLPYTEFGESPIAVALSGGPDSMALCYALSRQIAATGGPIVHALTVDHGLRAESAKEARAIGDWISDWPFVRHQILSLKKLPAGRLMEWARLGRYIALAAYCAEHGISRLYVAHHQDDQAETLLFRLAKGSGLDGLAAMRPEQPYSAALTLVRPLLDVPKARLVDFCDANNIPYVRDPTNSNPAYARGRLRAAAAVLAAEGMTARRMAVTAGRLRRAADALDHYADLALAASMVGQDERETRLALDNLLAAPPEIRLRVLLRVTGNTRQMRRERLEDLAEALFAPAPFPRRTLGGYMFARDDRLRLVVIKTETIKTENMAD